MTLARLILQDEAVPVGERATSVDGSAFLANLQHQSKLSHHPLLS